MTDERHKVRRIECPACGGRVKLPSGGALGERFRCPRCDGELVVRRSEGGEISLSGAKPGAAQPPAAAANDASRRRPESVARRPETITTRCEVCETRFEVQRSQLGRTVECPDCQTPLRVDPPAEGQAYSPGRRAPIELREQREAASTRPADPEPAPASSGAADEEIPVVCYVCETRMYARRDQIGQEITCPDCFQVQVVREPVRPARRSAAAPSGDGSEYRLSELFERPKYQPLSRDAPSRDDLDHLNWEPRDPDRADPAPVRAPRTAPPPPSGDLMGQCPACDARIYTKHDQVGKKISCPRCEVTFRFQPLPKKKASAFERAAAAAADEQQPSSWLARLVEEPEPSGKASESRSTSTSDDVLVKAEREWDEQQRKRPKLPAWPLWTGVLRPFGYPATILWWLTLSLGLIGLGTLWVTALANASIPDDGARQFVGLGMSILALLFSVMFVFAAAMGALGITLETGQGVDDLQAWPTWSFLDWMGEALQFITAVVYGLAPGALMYWLSGGPLTLTTFAVMWAGLFFIFPVSLLSILEAGSPLTPISSQVWRSLAELPAYWLAFYLLAALLHLPLIGGVLLLLAFDGAFRAWIVVSPLLVAGAFVYFRLLGRLAWVLHEKLEFVLAEDEDQGQQSDESQG